MFQVLNATRGTARPPDDRAEKERKKEYARQQFLRRFPASQRAMAEAKFDYLGALPPAERDRGSAAFDRYYQQTGYFLDPVRKAPSPRQEPQVVAAPAKQPEPEPKPEPQVVAAPAKQSEPETPDALKNLAKEVGLTRLSQAQLATKYDDLKAELADLRAKKKLYEEFKDVPYKSRPDSAKQFKYERYKELEKLVPRAAKAKLKEAEKKAKEEEKAAAKEAKPKRKPRAKKEPEAKPEAKPEPEKQPEPETKKRKPRAKKEPEPEKQPEPEKPQVGRPKKVLTEEETAEKKKKAAERQRAYRAKKKAEAENK